MGSAVLRLLLLLAAGAAADDRQVYTCNATQLLSPELIAEIRSYAPVVQSIIDYVLQGPERNRTYEELAKFVDRFGARISGSRNLENAIDYMVELLGRQELDRVYTERVAVPHWVRGNESAWIVRPRMQKLNMLGLGGSVGTSPSGITAPILVVRSFEELRTNASKARGKVVVFDEEFPAHGLDELRTRQASHSLRLHHRRGRAVAPKAPGQRYRSSRSPNNGCAKPFH
ncbi:hypothetical protein MRX96_031093 [Rhipicephalus microplus]